MSLIAEDVRRILGVSQEVAELVAGIAARTIDPLKHPKRFPATCKWESECLHRPWESEIRMQAINEVVGGYGVEPVDPEGAEFSRTHGRSVACYVNRGETYTPTIVYDYKSETHQLISMGDYVEKWEALNPSERDEALALGMTFR